jgi:hypothetical protein
LVELRELRELRRRNKLVAVDNGMGLRRHIDRPDVGG